MPSRLTNFIQDHMKDQLKPYLDSLAIGFSSKKEKSQENIRFDLYAYSRLNRVFLIWELEICNCTSGCIANIKKVKTILDRTWYPHVHMFHIFSPFCEPDAVRCESAAKKLQRKYEARFTYRQFFLNIPYDDFNGMYLSFERNRKESEREYGRRLKVHLGKIIRESIEMFTGK